MLHRARQSYRDAADETPRAPPREAFLRDACSGCRERCGHAALHASRHFIARIEAQSFPAFFSGAAARYLYLLRNAATADCRALRGEARYIEAQ